MRIVSEETSGGAHAVKSRGDGNTRRLRKWCGISLRVIKLSYELCTIVVVSIEVLSTNSWT